MARVPLEVVVLHFDVPELELQRSFRVAQFRDFFLEEVLRTGGLGFALLVFGLPLLDFKPQSFQLFLQTSFPFLTFLDILLQLGL